MKGKEVEGTAAHRGPKPRFTRNTFCARSRAGGPGEGDVCSNHSGSYPARNDVCADGCASVLY
jgi:hypothetical protein